MFEDKDRQLMFNHALGKLKLHSQSRPSSKFKVRLHKQRPGDPGTLDVSTRQYGQCWSWVDISRQDKALWVAIREFLILYKGFGHWFIQPEEFARLKERFDTVEQRAAERLSKADV